MKIYAIKKYKHAVPLIIYGIIYLTWFIYLEQKVTKDYRVIHVTLDDYIPFCEGFVIPYFLWFLYVSATVAYLFFKDKDDYYRTCIFLFTGMTVFLVISTLFPNGHHLRPQVMPRDNIFTWMVSRLYSTDTPTNLWPSIHVYNSLGAHFAIVKNNRLCRNRPVRKLSLLLCISIILSTMFIKQHSAFDVVTAFIMAAVMYGVVYKYDILAMHRLRAMRKKATPQIN
ncbi:MAG: serine/threonine protein phosphatase [Kineothrix sp.]|nr:serine/threonine protein phosphatase [Kineothrix sp.]NBI91629.1 serine/threonine protein phosphatase [Lachnospiraceae bacterium]